MPSSKLTAVLLLTLLCLETFSALTSFVLSSGAYFVSLNVERQTAELMYRTIHPKKNYSTAIALRLNAKFYSPFFTYYFKGSRL